MPIGADGLSGTVSDTGAGLRGGSLHSGEDEDPLPYGFIRLKSGGIGVDINIAREIGRKAMQRKVKEADVLKFAGSGGIQMQGNSPWSRSSRMQPSLRVKSPVDNDHVQSVFQKILAKKPARAKSEEVVGEVSPPGFSGTVKAMKKHSEIDNPFALAWWMKKKDYKSHEPEESIEELLGEADLVLEAPVPTAELAAKPPKGVDPIAWAHVVTKGNHTDYGGARAHYNRHVAKHSPKPPAPVGESTEHHPVLTGLGFRPFNKSEKGEVWYHTPTQTSLHINHTNKQFSLSQTGGGSAVMQGHVDSMGPRLTSFVKGVRKQNKWSLGRASQDYSDPTRGGSSTSQVMRQHLRDPYGMYAARHRGESLGESESYLTGSPTDKTRLTGQIHIRIKEGTTIDIRSPDRILDNVNAYLFFQQWEQYLPKSPLLQASTMFRISEWWKRHAERGDVLSIDLTTGGTSVVNESTGKTYTLGHFGSMPDSFSTDAEALEVERL